MATDLLTPRAFLEEYLASITANGNALAAGSVEVAPPVFSILMDPTSALRVADSMIVAANSGQSPICFDQTKCSTTDLCTQVLAAAIGRQIHCSGRVVHHILPQDPAAWAFCRCFAHPDVLKACGPVPPGMALYKPAQFLRGDPFDQDHYTKQISDWLKEQYENVLGYQLSDGFVHSLSNSVSEILDNAAVHGRGDCWVAAVLDRGRVRSGHLGRVEIAIINFGEPFDQTLMRLPLGDVPRMEIEALVRRHAQKELFSDEWTEYTLWVRHALQQRVTKYGSEQDWRGVGLLQLIDFYQELLDAGAEPECAVVTGSTYVRLSPLYKLKPSRSKQRRRFQDIAFNTKNSFEIPADPRCLRALDRFFPGTLVSLQFTITPHHLERMEAV